MRRLVGQHDLLAEVAEHAVRLGVDDDPVRGRLRRAPGLSGGDRGDPPVAGRRRAEQPRHALQRLRYEDDDVPRPVRAPGLGDGGHRAVRESRVGPQPFTGLPDPQDEAVRAPYGRHRALLPQLLTGLLRGHVGGDAPPPVVLDQAQGAGDRDGSPVVTLDAIAQFRVGGGPVPGTAQVGQVVRPGGQRDARSRRNSVTEPAGSSVARYAASSRSRTAVARRSRTRCTSAAAVSGAGGPPQPASTPSSSTREHPARDVRPRPATFPIVRRSGGAVRPASRTRSASCPPGRSAPRPPDRARGSPARCPRTSPHGSRPTGR